MMCLNDYINEITSECPGASQVTMYMGTDVPTVMEYTVPGEDGKQNMPPLANHKYHQKKDRAAVRDEGDELHGDGNGDGEGEEEHENEVDAEDGDGKRENKRRRLNPEDGDGNGDEMVLEEGDDDETDLEDEDDDEADPEDGDDAEQENEVDEEHEDKRWRLY